MKENRCVSVEVRNVTTLFGDVKEAICTFKDGSALKGEIEGSTPIWKLLNLTKEKVSEKITIR